MCLGPSNQSDRVRVLTGTIKPSGYCYSRVLLEPFSVILSGGQPKMY